MDGVLDRRPVLGRSGRVYWTSASQWRLRHELHPSASMALCSMHDERVAQPDVAGVTRGRDLGQMVALSREGTGCAEEFNRAVIAKYQSRGG